MLQSQIILEEQLFRLYALGVWFPSDSLPPSLDPDEQRGLRWMAPKLPEGLHNLRLLRPSPCLSSFSRISKTPFGGRQTYGCWSCWSKTSPSDQWDTQWKSDVTPNCPAHHQSYGHLSVRSTWSWKKHQSSTCLWSQSNTKFDASKIHHPQTFENVVWNPWKAMKQDDIMWVHEKTRYLISGPVAALTYSDPPSLRFYTTVRDPLRSAPVPPFASWCFVRGASGRNWAAGVASSLGSPGSKGLGSYNHGISGTWWICYGLLWVYDEYML